MQASQQRRQQHTKLLSKTTNRCAVSMRLEKLFVCRGQPLMKHRMALMLDKIQASKQK